MAVILTDMDIPASCAWCEFGERVDNSHNYCKRKPTEPPVPDGEGRPWFCPMKDLPDYFTANIVGSSEDHEENKIYGTLDFLDDLSKAEIDKLKNDWESGVISWYTYWVKAQNIISNAAKR